VRRVISGALKQPLPPPSPASASVGFLQAVDLDARQQRESLAKEAWDSDAEEDEEQHPAGVQCAQQ
jgi:hypothetical protein